MSDLVKRLRELEAKLPTSSDNWIEARELQLEAAARIEALEAALKPFADAYLKKRIKYAKRYGDDVEIGLKNFDKMPEEWRMEGVTFDMGTFRHAASLLEKKP